LFVVQVVVTLNSFIKPFKSYYKILNKFAFHEFGENIHLPFKMYLSKSLFTTLAPEISWRKTRFSCWKLLNFKTWS